MRRLAVIAVGVVVLAGAVLMVLARAESMVERSVIVSVPPAFAEAYLRKAEITARVEPDYYGVVITVQIPADGASGALDRLGLGLVTGDPGLALERRLSRLRGTMLSAFAAQGGHFQPEGWGIEPQIDGP